MFLKILVSFFSVLVFVKNISFSMYEYDINKNSIGAVCVVVVSFVSLSVLNVVLFLIKF